MRSVRAELRAAGIWGADENRPLPPLECVRITRRLRDRQVRALGLVPAGDDVAIPAIALELGRSFAYGSGGAVAVIDVHGSWPGAGALVEATPAFAPLPTCWLEESLALVTLRGVEAGARLGRLRGVVLERPGAFEHVVADLTGLDRRGELLEAVGLMDTVALVARAGRTTTRQIRRRLRDMPCARSVGVLLTGL